MLAYEDTATALKRVDDMLLEFLRRQAVAGLCAVVVQDGRPLYTRSMGLSDVRRGRAVTSGTIFGMGSIAKTLTAIGIMQLWERGCFQLDDPVNGYLRGYRVEPPTRGLPEVTFRHLLTHTAGLGALRRVSDLLHPTGHLALKPNRPIPSLCDYYAPVLRAEVPPGSRFAYTNHDFATLGQLITNISGQPFTRYMAEHVLEPLGMTHTDFVRSPRVRQRLAMSHRVTLGRPRPAPYMSVIPGPAGSLFSNIDDMARYLAALMGDGANEHGRVLKAETMHLMLTPHYAADERLPAMGLGFMLSTMAGQPIAGHDGVVPWFTASLLVAPNANLGLVVATNTYHLGIITLSRDLLRHLLTTLCPTVAGSHPQVPESPQLWSELRGSYGPPKGLLTNLMFWANWGGEAEVIVEDGHLAMCAMLPLLPRSKSVRLVPGDPADPFFFITTFQGRTEPVLFRRSTGKQVDTLYVGLFFTLIKRSSLRSLRTRLRAVFGVLAGILTVVLIHRAAAHTRTDNSRSTGC